MIPFSDFSPFACMVIGQNVFHLVDTYAKPLNYLFFLYRRLNYSPPFPTDMTIPVSIDGNDRAEGVYNENIEILCRANGYPLPVVTWYKDNEEITAVFDPRWVDNLVDS